MLEWNSGQPLSQCAWCFCQRRRQIAEGGKLCLSVCGNLQHIWQHIIFLSFLLLYKSAIMPNAAKISYTNFQVNSVLKKKSLAY
jgi:hypothetical protein